MSPTTPTKGVPKMNQSSVMFGLNLKCPCDPATPIIKRKHPATVTQVKKTIRPFIGGFIGYLEGLIACFCNDL